jgi:glutamate-1-semialdehyde 2,1-aminomutase
MMSDRYRNSEKMLERALKTIPLGSQTFSKSKTQYPYGVSPYFITKGDGSHVWDVDGNEYVDFINSLAAITLGHNDPDVTAAVKAQLDDGVIFSLPHPLEHQVAEKIVEIVPCAEMVRFGKNGSDATSGAIRLARAYTNRDHVAACGYHGWQDWYIGATTRNRGVPQSTRDLTHLFTYNEIDSLHKIFKDHPGQVAAVIMEPMNTTEPKDAFLNKVQAMSHQHGAVFIFDETITGFRYANGGAQEYFGVTPDLATFGKGLANGYPVSAVAGKAEIMRLMEEIFFSFTFGGETLSLAAALAAMTKLQAKPVIKTLWSQGNKIVDGSQVLIKKHGLENVVSLQGKDCWSFLVFKDSEGYSQWEFKTLFLQEVFARGILAIGTHNMSYAHSDEDISKLLKTYDAVFGIIREVVEKGNLKERLKTEPLIPLFKIR